MSGWKRKRYWNPECARDILVLNEKEVEPSDLVEYIKVLEVCFEQHSSGAIETSLEELREKYL